MPDEHKKQTVLDFFAAHAIPYRLYEHPAFFTVAEAHAYRDSQGSVFHTPGVVGCKNLFLKNYVEKPTPSEEYRYYLYVLPDDARADLKAFATHVGEKKVTFGSPEELLHFLGVTPGSVSLCGLLNDTTHTVRVYVDARVHRAPMLHLHPNINTASLEMDAAAYAQYLAALARPMHVYEPPLESAR